MRSALADPPSSNLPDRKGCFVYRLDGEDGFNDFEFPMPIEPSNWLKEAAARPVDDACGAA